jgi:hypothetical protein
MLSCWMLFINDDQLQWPTPTSTVVDDADNHLTPLSGCYARCFALLQANNNELIVGIGIKDDANSYGALTITLLM